MKIGLLLQTFIMTRWFRKFSTRDQLMRYQTNRLQKQWDYFKKHSPYFKQVDSIKSFPTMNKAFMMEHFDQLNTVQLKKDEIMELALKNEQTREFHHNIGHVSVGLSSGTSGHRGIFMTTEEEQAIWAGTIMAKLLPKRRILGHKIAFFLRANNQLYETVQSKVLQFRYFDTFLPVAHHITILNTYQPSILIAPASMLVMLAKAIENKELHIQPSMIVSVAEVLEEADRDYLLNQFNVAVIHQIYQATEGFIACTCEYGHLHINEDVVKIDKKNIDEKRFYPIITDLHRRSQPIIHYELNDILVENSNPCPCGSVFMRIEKIEGRSDDIFIFENTNGEVVPVFPDFIRRCMLFVSGIREYQVNQISRTQIEIAVEDITPLQQQEIMNEFKKLANSMNFIEPSIVFTTYQWNPTIKLKRINKSFKE